MRRTPISSLFLGRGPHAITRLIATIVVLSVNADPTPWRSLSHVGQEILKLAPSLAEGDASAAVTRPFSVAGIQAAPDQAAPGVVDGRSTHSVAVGWVLITTHRRRVAMKRSLQLSTETATASYPAFEKNAPFDDLLTTAFADASIVRLMVTLSPTRWPCRQEQWFNRPQSTKRVAQNVGVIDMFRHFDNYTAYGEMGGVEWN